MLHDSKAFSQIIFNTFQIINFACADFEASLKKKVCNITEMNNYGGNKILVSPEVIFKRKLF